MASWLKKPGDAVERDEPVVELETDKVTLEVNAAGAGTLQEIRVEEGESVEVGTVLGLIGEGDAAPAPAPKKAADKKKSAEAEQAAAPAPAPEPAEEERGRGGSGRCGGDRPAGRAQADRGARARPGAHRGYRQGRPDHQGGRAGLPERGAAPAGAVDIGRRHPGAGGGAPKATMIEVPAYERPSGAPRPQKDREERVRMSKLRRTIASRLKQAQNTAAMLTTFNEVDLGELIAMRTKYRDSFEKKHGVRLGFMSFFAKACVQALKELPAVNAEIDGDEIVYKNYYDIGVAVGTPQGLVVPVVRDCDQLSFAEIEKTVGDLGRRARDGKLKIEEITGGTFTITNGGVYGSLMSMPILNPPQSGILGMHKIQERPVAVNGKVEIRPMMYLALSYDHRIIDGREAVTFLVRVKENLEDPERLMLEV